MCNIELVPQILRALPEGSVGRYDLLPVFECADLFSKIVTALADPFAGKVDYVASPEAIGWILGVGVAKELNVGFIPLRKAGKLPYSKDYLFSSSYVDYTQKEKTLEIRKDALAAGSRVLIVDEWVETGTSMRCCIDLLERIGCKIEGLATIGIDYNENTKQWIDSGFIAFIGRDI